MQTSQLPHTPSTGRVGHSDWCCRQSDLSTEPGFLTYKEWTELKWNCNKSDGTTPTKLFHYPKLPCYCLLTISFIFFRGSTLTSPYTSRSFLGVLDKTGVAGWLPGFTSLFDEACAMAQSPFDRSCWWDVLNTTPTSIKVTLLYVKLLNVTNIPCA